MREFSKEAAAQVWCRPETRHMVKDSVLCQAFAEVLDGWIDALHQESRNAAFYRDILDRCAQILGMEAFTADDGSVGDSPLRLKIPELIAALIARKAPAAMTLSELNWEIARLQHIAFLRVLGDPRETVVGSPAPYDAGQSSGEVNMATMRAKFQVGFVQEFRDRDGKVYQETLTMHAVARSSYPEDGSDEDNTYARWSPGANLMINIANPALFGQFKVGEKYYVDFSPAETKASAEKG